jgi:preprotein translocase subunit SecA
MISLIRKMWTALTRIGGRAIDVSISSYQQRGAEIQQRTDELVKLPEAELHAMGSQLRQRVQTGTSLEHVLIDLFALASTAAFLTLGMRPFDVQLVAAQAINDGKIAQMQTGEGKTLAAVLPACLNALLGKGVHILTFNDYLAARDAEWMGPIYRMLGLSVGCVTSRMTPAERRAAYACDVTYSTAKEVGFDFLRDQLSLDARQFVQRDHAYAIIDEADSLLIDQGRIPLVIATSRDDNPADLYRYANLVRTMRPRIDYEIDAAWRNVSYNGPGLDRLQRELHSGELHSVQHANLLARLNLALHAQVLMQRDVHYIVRDGQIHLVDELTGRVVENRRWPWGLQAAVEAKERVEIQPEGKILNSITLQHFFNLYPKIGGMTATAQDAADELHEFYSTKIVIVPPNRPCRRNDEPDQIFPTKRRKLEAVVSEIASEHRRGRPVLVGTDSVAESERLANHLLRMGISCNVLNAKNDHAEASLVAEAGAIGAVTISTNMAGRGTDIRLGGSQETDRDRVIDLGGLYVMGTCRNESRRIDNQLRGRAGRQGDPGMTRFFVSLEDDLLVRHGIRDDESIEMQVLTDQMLNARDASAQIAHIQRVIEGENLEIHRTLRKYSHLIEQQRKQVQQYRSQALTGSSDPMPLAANDDDRRLDYVQRYGRDTFTRVDRRLTLQTIDECWSDYLERVAEIREGIHLVSMGGMNTMDVFNHEVAKTFRTFLRRVNEKKTLAIEQFFQNRDTGQIADDDISNGSSATWTYMVNDNPMGDFFERIRRNVQQRLKG